jgi:hypothetical protein
MLSFHHLDDTEPLLLLDASESLLVVSLDVLQPLLLVDEPDSLLLMGESEPSLGVRTSEGLDAALLPVLSESTAPSDAS